MKLFSGHMPPNPRRVNQFCQYKGIQLDTEYLDLMQGHQFSEAYRKINPMMTIPALVLDDGTVLTEVVGVLLYLESVYPEKPLLGEPGLEQAQVIGWMHGIFNSGFASVAEVLRNSLPAFANRALPGPLDLEQIPALADRGRKRLAHFYQTMNEILSGRHFLVGEHLTQADIDLRVTCDFAAIIRQKVPPECEALAAHQHRVSELIPLLPVA